MAVRFTTPQAHPTPSFVAILLRIASRKNGFDKNDDVGPRLAVWIDRMQTLPIVQQTWLPHWK
jgi:hypothetical protein